MATFSYDKVVEYITRVQQESYCMTVEYSSSIDNEEWYLKSLENGASYTWYSAPAVPYIEERLMESDDEEDNTDLLRFLICIFINENRLVQNDNENMCKIAKEMYDKL